MEKRLRIFCLSCFAIAFVLLIIGAVGAATIVPDGCSGIPSNPKSGDCESVQQVSLTLPNSYYDVVAPGGHCPILSELSGEMGVRVKEIVFDDAVGTRIEHSCDNLEEGGKYPYGHYLRFNLDRILKITNGNPSNLNGGSGYVYRTDDLRIYNDEETLLYADGSCNQGYANQLNFLDIIREGYGSSVNYGDDKEIVLALKAYSDSLPSEPQWAEFRTCVYVDCDLNNDGLIDDECLSPANCDGTAETMQRKVVIGMDEDAGTRECVASVDWAATADECESGILATKSNGIDLAIEGEYPCMEELVGHFDSENQWDDCIDVVNSALGISIDAATFKSNLLGRLSLAGYRTDKTGFADPLYSETTTIDRYGVVEETIPICIRPLPAEVHECSSGDVNDVIYSLYTKDNSHFAVHDDPNYNYDICYDEIFGQSYSGTNPWDCSVNQVVIRATGNTNAHVEDPAGTTAEYGDYCYGNLVCAIENVGGNTGALCGDTGDEVIARLSDITNAHIAAPESQDAIDNYDYAICCQPIIVPVNTDRRWKSWEGVDYNIGAKVGVGWQVKMDYMKTGTSDGDQVGDFTVYKVGDTTPIDTISGITFEGEHAVADWTIDQVLSVGDEIYFNVDGEDSYNIEIESEPNTRPRANIESPVHRQIYFAESAIEFKGKCTDLETEPIYAWKVIDPNGEEVDLSSIEESQPFDLKFDSPGQADITLRCIDSKNTNLWDEKSISIVVTASPSMISYVNDPFHREKIIDDDLHVEVSAEDSYVIQNTLDSGCSGKITCLAGYCPIKTMNYPTSCEGNERVDEDGRITLTVGDNQGITTYSEEQVIEGGFADLSFSWSFDDGYTTSAKDKASFTRIYGISSRALDDKRIDLTLDYNGLISQDTSRVFTLLVSGGGCFPDIGKDVDVGSDGFIDEERDITEVGGCVGPDGEPNGEEGGDDCCLPGYICFSANGDSENARCVPDRDPVISCGEYKTEPLCDKDLDDAAHNPDNPEISESPECGLVENGHVWKCGDCFWDKDDEDHPDGICKLDKYLERGEYNPADPVMCKYSCPTYAEELEACDETTTGFKRVRVTKDLVIDPTCMPSGVYSCDEGSQERNVRCYEQVRVEFFTLRNLIVTVVVLIAIYALYLAKKRKK